ncbi:MAG TPA: hypothetical protein VF950_03075 [Planctomycetota bacterium]
MASQAPRPPSSVTVPCRCGAYHIVPVAQFGRVQMCGKCGSGYSVVWKKDPKSGKNTPLVVASAKSRRLRTPKPSTVPPESMIDMACGCGYRRKATPEEFRKAINCPGCANPMYVDRPSRAKQAADEKPFVPYVEKTRYGGTSRIAKVESGPVPRPKLTTRPPSGDLPKVAASETKRTMSGKILVICKFCGSRLLVQAERKGDKVKCMSCDRELTVWAPPTGATPPAFAAPGSTPPPIPASHFEDPAARTPPPLRAPTPSAFLTGPTLDCPCGTVMDVRGASPGSVHACPSCGRQVTMEKRRHPQTLTTVMMPIFSEPPPEPEPEPTVSLEPGALEILCACGEALIVSLRDVGHPVQCPGCSLLLEIQQAPGGLKVKPIGRIDEQNWSLQDFS